VVPLDYSTNPLTQAVMNALLSTLPTAPEVTPRFSALGRLTDLQQRYETTTYPKGHTLFQEKHTPWGLFYIQKGKVKLHKYGSDGKEQIIRIAGAGDFIGYTALLNNAQYNMSATVLEEATVAFIPHQDFLEVFGRDHGVSNHFTQLLCRDIMEAEQRLVAQSYQPMRVRLADTLLSLDDFYEQCNDDDDGFINLSRYDLASLLGSAKETIIRLLSEFKAEKLIATQGQSIAILNPQGLRHISQMYS